MYLSQREKQTIEACRFCWMCRHICPIGNVTGQERNNARGRALSLSMIDRGTELTVDTMENVYECGLCGACTKDCATGFDPVAFTKAVRTEGINGGVIPKSIEKLLVNIEECGNPYGLREMDIELKKTIESLPIGDETLLFLGTDTRFKSGKSGQTAIKLLQKAAIKFTVLAEEPDSGALFEQLAGKTEEGKQVMLRCAAVLNQYKEVVVYDPYDAKVFLREYKEWGIAITAKVITFTSYILQLLKNGKWNPKQLDKTVVFQDPAALARDLEEVAPARGILSRCANTKEMLLYGKETVWAGNLLMKEYLPRVMELTAKERWKHAVSAGADALVTACPSEYEVLNQVKPENMELLRLEEVVLGGHNECL